MGWRCPRGELAPAWIRMSGEGRSMAGERQSFGEPASEGGGGHRFRWPPSPVHPSRFPAPARVATQVVPPGPAGDELVVKPGPKPLGSLCTRWGVAALLDHGPSQLPGASEGIGSWLDRKSTR